MKTLGEFLRERRLELQARDARFSLTQVAQRVGVTPAFLSQVERGQARSGPAEETLRLLARELEVDADLLLALGGKVSGDLQEAIRRRPVLFAQLIRELRDLPDHAVLRLVREVRDGEW
jgi:HTH-type transcriptional regulator, competence development regulator